MKKEKRKLSKQIAVRLPPLAFDILLDESDKKNVSSASYVRDLIVSHFKTKEDNFKPTQKRGLLPDADILEIRKLRESCAELCGALVQSAIKTKNFNQQTHDEIEALLIEIKPLVLDLDNLRIKLRKRK